VQYMAGGIALQYMAAVQWRRALGCRGVLGFARVVEAAAACVDSCLDAWCARVCVYTGTKVRVHVFACKYY